MEARQTVCGLEISVWALSTVDSREHTAIITAEMENRNAVWLTVTSGVTRQRSSQKAVSYTHLGRVNAEVVNLLRENARFAERTYRIAQYFDDTFASGIAAQNAMLTTLSTLLRTKVKTCLLYTSRCV